MSEKASLLEQPLSSFKQPELIIELGKSSVGEPLTKTAQAVLVHFQIMMISSGKNQFSFQQRTLASQLNTHYNSIYNALKVLQTQGYLEKEGKNRQTTIVLNLEKFSLLPSLSLLSSSFRQKLLESNCQLEYDEKRKGESLDQQPLVDEQLTAQLTFLLKKKEELAKELAQNILQALREADKSTLQALSSDDYQVIITQEFDKLFTYFEVGVSPPKTSSSSETIRLTKAKLGKV